MKLTNALKLPLLAVALVGAGCAKPPTEAVAGAKEALQKAVGAEAADYAPAELQQAQDAMASLDAELTAQEGRFALTRTYEKAGQLATAARTAAESAATAAAAGREAARNEATIAIESLRASVDEVKLLLEQAPKGKGTAADLEAMKSDLAAIESSLGELDQSMGQGHFKDASVKARAALDSANTIKADITAAMEARKAGRRRG